MIASLREDRCRLLYVSPERLVGEGSQGFRRLLQQCGVRYHRHRRGALHQPVGPRLPAGIPAARAAARRLSAGLAACLHGDGDRARATRHRQRSCGCAIRSCWSARSIGPNLMYRVLRRGNLREQLLQILARHEDEAGIVYCPSRREVESLAEWLRGRGLPRGAVSRRPGRRRTRAASGGISRRARGHRRGDRRVRHGHRSIERAVRHPRRRAAVAGALSAGVRTGGTRRPAGRVRARSTRAPTSCAGGRCSRRTAS